MILFHNDKKFTEHKYTSEAQFEKDLIDSKHAIFGPDTIYIDTKKKIGSHALGNTVPDGFLFDMSDPENREFYLVEIELETHDFYNHIFPQITKFFAFYRNGKKQRELVEKLFAIINGDSSLKRQFKKYLGEKEIFKFLNDLIDSSQNILLLIDGEKPELPEITDTYSDTWGKMVKVMTVKRYMCKEESIFAIHPEFETIEYAFEETPTEAESKGTSYSEEFHLGGVANNVKEIYAYLKVEVAEIDPSFIFNPQKYYISIKGPKNIIFFQIRKKKIRMIIMLPEAEIRTAIVRHNVTSLSESVQKFYNGPCGAVDVHNLDNIEEVLHVIKTLMLQNLCEETPNQSMTPIN